MVDADYLLHPMLSIDAGRVKIVYLLLLSLFIRVLSFRLVFITMLRKPC